MAKELKDLTKRAENYSQWYNELVVKADLAEQSSVRGCIKRSRSGHVTAKTCQTCPSGFVGNCGNSI